MGAGNATACLVGIKVLGSVSSSIFKDVCDDDLPFFFSYISDALGLPPLIDDLAFPSNLPADVNDLRFNPTTHHLESVKPVEDGELGENATHFILKCQ